MLDRACRMIPYTVKLHFWGHRGFEKSIQKFIIGTWNHGEQTMKPRGVVWRLQAVAAADFIGLSRLQISR